MMNIRKLLVIEPYWGGSHRQFITGLQQHIDAQCQIMTLPARNWKMRMQLSAPWACNCLKNLPRQQRHFDTVLCSTFVDVATMRSLLARLPGWNSIARFCTYFHENQFAYPERLAEGANRQFAAINYTTALASDRLAFNSKYNQQTFIDGCSRYLCKDKEMMVQGSIGEILLKSRVLHPGLNYAEIDESSANQPSSIPVIVWNHRWEHDKNPEEFCSALKWLDNQGMDFKIIVLGQAFQEVPRCFTEVRSLLANRILHFAYAPTRQAYAALLRNGTIVVSTAQHEFFGVAILEAVRAGCLPLLPERLAYPELFPQQYLYSENDLIKKLTSLVQKNCRISDDERLTLTENFSWQNVREDFFDWLFGEDGQVDICQE